MRKTKNMKTLVKVRSTPPLKLTETHLGERRINREGRSGSCFMLAYLHQSINQNIDTYVKI